MWYRYAQAQIKQQAQTSEEHPWDTQAKADYGLTEDPTLAGYVMKDGSMLDFSGGMGSRAHDHRNVGYLVDDIDESEYGAHTKMMRRFMAQTGAARVNHTGEGWSILDFSHPLTPQQMSTLMSHHRGGQFTMQARHPETNDVIDQHDGLEVSRIEARRTLDAANKKLEALQVPKQAQPKLLSSQSMQGIEAEIQALYKQVNHFANIEFNENRPFTPEEAQQRDGMYARLKQLHDIRDEQRALRRSLGE